MRTLLRDFADHGGTVLLSSHLLHEVQATADHLVVISGGAVVAAGRLDDLLASSTILVRSPDPGALPRRSRLRGSTTSPGRRCAHRGRLRRSGHDRGAGGRRPRPPGAAHRVASVRDKRAGTAVLLSHRRQGGSAPGGCSMTTSLSPEPSASTRHRRPQDLSRSHGLSGSSGPRPPIPALPAGSSLSWPCRPQG